MDSLRSALGEVGSGEWGVGEVAFQSVLALWRARLASGWTPPENSGFPWAQVKLSLAALVAPPTPHSSLPTPPNPRVLSLICAGNTPLLAWPAMLFALRHGVPLFVKMSSSETLWPQLLKESIDEVSSEAGRKLICDAWPREDPRTEELINLSNAIIAYGSDNTIEKLREIAGEKLFIGFGHAISIAFGSQPFTRQLARDILMFDQSGCLSPQVIFVSEDIIKFTKSLSGALSQLSDNFSEERTDISAASHVRQIRDLARMDGATVIGDESLRWTIIQYADPIVIPKYSGSGIVSVIPLAAPARFVEFMGDYKGKISGVGFCGSFSPFLHSLVKNIGATYVCKAGKMQTPPLDWKNGGVDLEAWIAKFSPF